MKYLPCFFAILIQINACFLAASFCYAQNEGEQVKPLFRLVEQMDYAVSRELKQQLVDEVRKIKEQLDAGTDSVPYKEPDIINRLLNLQFGPQGLEGGYRYFSGEGIPRDHYCIDQLTVVDGHLINENAENIWESNCEGYIKGSIVVVNGTVHLGSYIRDSIVIAAGPVRIEDGYVYNSLVISLAEETPAIEASDCYLNNCVVAGETVLSEDIRDSVVFGRILDRRKVDISDQDGNAVSDSDLVRQLIRQCEPRRELRTTAASITQEPESIPVGAVVDKLIQTTVKSEKAFLIDFLGELTVSDRDVQRLIENAGACTSEEARIMAWHAVRVCRSREAREYLLEQLVEADAETIVRFLQTLSCEDPHDLVLLTSTYERFVDIQPAGPHTDVHRSILALLDEDLSRKTYGWTSHRLFDEQNPAAEADQHTWKFQV